MSTDGPAGDIDHPPFTHLGSDAPDPAAIAAIGTGQAATAVLEAPDVEDDELSIAQINQLTEEEWLEEGLQGRPPQLTFRAVAMGAILGSLMSIANLYTMVKIGWGFCVAITCCVLSYVIWNSLRAIFPKLSPMTILENNCMQSTASAARILDRLDRWHRIWCAVDDYQVCTQKRKYFFHGPSRQLSWGRSWQFQ